MAVDLEALAMKSIEQYAGMNVRLLSIEQTLKENNRRNESKEEKFALACENLARVTEKMEGFDKEKVIIHKRIDELKEAVNELTDAVRDIAGSLEDHSDDHCNDCQNLIEMNSIKAQLNNPPLPEVRELVATKWGMNWVRFITSRYGVAWVCMVTVGGALSVMSQAGVLDIVLTKLHLK